MKRTLLLPILVAAFCCAAVARDAAASSSPRDVPALTAAPAVYQAPAMPATPRSGPLGLLLVGMAAAATAAAPKKAAERREPDDPTTEHVSPGIEQERKRFGKYHGLDPWDTATLLVSQPGTGRVYDVREMPQSRPGFVVGEDGREFAIGPNVIAVADGDEGSMREPEFDKESHHADDDATGSK